MNYYELNCRVEPRDPWADVLISQLADLGFESFEETPSGFKAYINASEYKEETIRPIFQVRDQHGPRKLSYEVLQIGGKNWNELWESHFEPVVLENRCHIRAPFHPQIKGMEYDVVIEPKMSFGTGHHETTVLMVEWILETPMKNSSLLDMGCGTGVLAILGSMAGARPVTAIDNYLYAWENTVENAQRNNQEHIRVLHGDASLLGDETFDIILANITRNVLLEDIPGYCKVLNADGILILSGFLSFDKELIYQAATKQGLEYIGEKELKDWIAVQFKKTDQNVI